MSLESFSLVMVWGWIYPVTNILKDIFCCLSHWQKVCKDTLLVGGKVSFYLQRQNLLEFEKGGSSSQCSRIQLTPLLLLLIFLILCSIMILQGITVSLSWRRETSPNLEISSPQPPRKGKTYENPQKMLKNLEESFLQEETSSSTLS